MLSVIYAECLIQAPYGARHYAECRGAHQLSNTCCDYWITGLCII
jgi:hypothetical protein